MSRPRTPFLIGGEYETVLLLLHLLFRKQSGGCKEGWKSGQGKRPRWALGRGLSVWEKLIQEILVKLSTPVLKPVLSHRLAGWHEIPLLPRTAEQTNPVGRSLPPLSPQKYFQVKIHSFTPRENEGDPVRAFWVQKPLHAPTSCYRKGL